MFRLKSVYIKDYKNIQDQTFDFSTNTGYIALIGLNGSGKSNLLEAISIIFNDLYGIAHTEQVNGYSITFQLNDKDYTYATVDDTEEHNLVPLSAVDKGNLPSSVIACYSGEDPRLWSMAYRPYYLGFFSNALHGKDYVPKTMYINKYCWKIALISLLFSLDRDVQQFVKNVLHIDVKNVTIQFTYNDIANPQPHDAYNWLNRVKKKFGVDKIKFTDLRDFGLENIKHMDLTEDKLIFYYLYFLHLPKKTPNQPIDKLISTISIKLDSIEFDSLSEGQKKMILIACITRILGDENSLVLLDEPDAHVHIENKEKILETITQYNGQTILTTHSPIFINHMVNNNIYPIDNGHVINAEQRDLITKLANNSINYIDGACLISSKHLVLTEGPGDINYITAAIKACGKNDNQYKALENVSFAYIGGANLVSEYYKEILSHLYRTLDRVIFVFDLDNEGREGARQAQQLINEGKDKIKVIYYNSTYPIVDPNNSDFYVEDMFPRRIYSIINLPNINGVPTYAQLKKGSTWANNIKNKIADLYKKQLLKDEDYYYFKPFLLQLKQELGL